MDNFEGTMQIESTDAKEEEMLLQNALLFNAIRKNKTSEEKLQKISKYLGQGADINAVDANNKHNTPLHVAVSKGELEVVTFLLKKGASATCKNVNNQTALDIALMQEIPNAKELVSVLKSHNIEHKDEVHSENTNNQANSPQIQEQCEKATKITKALTQFYYQKRSGTSGLSGQLYETKLLSLILLRALYDDRIDGFFLGTNVEGMGAFDDVVFRYNVKGSQKSKIIFLQAKHRDNPTKDKITVEEVLKQNGDFSLNKYLESYLKICRKFSPDNKDNLFKGSMKDVDCDFIIFTSALENFTKKKIIDPIDGEYYIKTNNNGQIFHFDYDDEDIELLVRTISRSRAVVLAKRLCKFILKDNNNYKNMMLDDLIKTFHIFLVQNVIALELDLKSNNSYCSGSFRETFLTSNDEIFILMRHTILKEILEINIVKSNDQQEQVHMRTLTFKLPVNFGNINFSFTGTEAKKQRRLNYLNSRLQNLLQNAQDNDLKYSVVKVDDSMIGPHGVLQHTDLEMYRLGGLVGNLLIFDDETKMLKFNLDVQNISEDNKTILTRLVESFQDLGRYRLNFNILGFPKVSLVYGESDRNLVKDFLNHLKFYTNQAKEDEVENILKQEIDKFCNIQLTQNEPIFRIKCDMMFLKVHDKIQKWWKQSARAPYLTQACNFYYESEKDILDSPLLSFLNIIYCENMKNILAEFESDAIESLKINDFLEDKERIMVISSEEIMFSSIKVIQHFNETQFSKNSVIIDLDFVIIENLFEALQSELKKSKVNILTVVCAGSGKVKKIHNQLKIVKNTFSGKIIIITHSYRLDNLKTIFTENIVHETDNRNSFKDLRRKFREIIRKERNITFLGEKVPIGTILDSESELLAKNELLRKILNHENVEIGKTLTNPSYNTIADFYMNQSICRCVTLDIQKETHNDLHIKDNDTGLHLVPQGTSDVVIITESEMEFEKIHSKHSECNVHWFTCKDNYYLWKRSQGSLQTLLKYTDRGTHESLILRPQTLKDIEEKFVIISAEPGMGKSTLLTHLAIHTKHMYPNLWISKINLLEHIRIFSNWKQNKTNINLKTAVMFLHDAIHVKRNEEHNRQNKNILENLANQIRIDNMNQLVYLANDEGKDLDGLTLFEMNLFNHFYNNSRVALLFDGFDEICPDYANEVIQLLCTLKTSKVALMWVTTRSYNVLNQLECGLNTVSYTLQGLTRPEQEQFLQKIWSAKLGIDSALSSNYLDDFFKLISLALHDYNKTFTCFPLHLYMISEVFQDYCRYYHDPTIKFFSDEYLDQVLKSFNLTSIYETFVDMKFFKIRFGEKKHFMCFKDPDMRKLVETERKTFLEYHKKVAAYILLRKEIVMDIFSRQEVKEINEFIESVKSGEEKSGIIERVEGNDPKFVHLTFAEYFASEFIFDTLNFGSCSAIFQKNVGDDIFMATYEGVGRFIISKLIKDKKLFDLSSNTSHICTVFNSLVSQNYVTTDSSCVAGKILCEQILMFFFACTATASTDDNYRKFSNLFCRKCHEDDCLYCYECCV